jgi:hypothetical protein
MQVVNLILFEGGNLGEDIDLFESAWKVAVSSFKKLSSHGQTTIVANKPVPAVTVM